MRPSGLLHLVLRSTPRGGATPAAPRSPACAHGADRHGPAAGPAFAAGWVDALLWALAVAGAHAGPPWLTRGRLRGLLLVAVAHFAERSGAFALLCLGVRTRPSASPSDRGASPRCRAGAERAVAAAAVVGCGGRLDRTADAAQDGCEVTTIPCWPRRRGSVAALIGGLCGWRRPRTGSRGPGAGLKPVPGPPSPRRPRGSRRSIMRSGFQFSAVRCPRCHRASRPGSRSSAGRARRRGRSAAPAGGPERSAPAPRSAAARSASTDSSSSANTADRVGDDGGIERPQDLEAALRRRAAATGWAAPTPPGRPGHRRR